MAQTYRAERTHSKQLGTRPPEPIDLRTAAKDLLTQLEGAESLAVTLAASSGAPLTQTLLAIKAGSRLPDHEDPGAATLQGVLGRLRLVTGEGAHEVGEGQLLAVHGGRHHLEAVEDAVVLITLAQVPD